MICRGENAVFNLRLTESTEKIVVGGEDIYKSVCRKCYNENNRSIEKDWAWLINKNKLFLLYLQFLNI